MNIFCKFCLHNNFRNLVKLTFLQLNRYYLITMQYQPKKKHRFTWKSSEMGCSPLTHLTWSKTLRNAIESYLLLDFDRQVDFFFLKINKFDEFIRIQRLCRREPEPTLDKNVTEIKIIYQYVFCINIIFEILVESK